MTTPVTPQNLNTLQLPVELTRQPLVRRRGLWLALAATGLLVVASEAVWLSRDLWLRQPVVRNALNPVLAAAGYELERPHLAGAWQISALTLRAEAGVPGVWHVDALLQHHADILQTWPALTLELRDWQGQLAGQRTLQPTDYLPSGLPAGLAPHRLVASEQPVRISLAVRLPARADGSIPVFEQAELRALP